MKYIIYGVNRIAKDFLYIFEYIEPLYFIDEDYSEKNFMGKNVLGFDEFIQEYNKDNQIIVCGKDKTIQIEKLEQQGLVYKKDYLYEVDFFEKLDDKKINPENKKICVWGTGKYAETLLEWNHKIKIEFFIDSKKDISNYRGFLVKKPEDIKNIKEYFIIIAVKRDIGIIKFLESMEAEEYLDYVNMQQWIHQPSKMLSKTIWDENYYEIECNTMLNHGEILNDGEVFDCCSAFVYGAIGDVNKASFMDIWNSNVHRIECLALQNRTYSFCKKEMCPLFIGKKSNPLLINEEKSLNRNYKKMLPYPTTSLIGFDSTCNLRCESCRDDICVARDEELKKSLKYADIFKKEVLPNTDFLIMAGNGEVFFSKVYKEVYTSKEIQKTKYIRILSNGTLFNEKNWNEFYENKTGKIMLTVSIDAATKETYEELRRNGNFDILKTNMEFASKLRKEGKLSYFRINFVVQKKNYKEIIPFVEWGKQLEADEVFFTKILNWGTYTDEEFAEISMMEADGATPKEALREIIENPVMKDRIVDMGTIQYGHEAIEDVIENYYRWELKRKVPNLFD